MFSHPSKVELIQRAVGAGYLVELHVMLVPEELAVRRVDYRVRHGGHPVPEPTWPAWTPPQLLAAL